MPCAERQTTKGAGMRVGDPGWAKSAGVRVKKRAWPQGQWRLLTARAERGPSLIVASSGSSEAGPEEDSFREGRDLGVTGGVSRIAVTASGTLLYAAFMHRQDHLFPMAACSICSILTSGLCICARSVKQ